ncbi:MAG: hypothetical protein ACREI3_12040 [Nitrospirales bacterium]
MSSLILAGAALAHQSGEQEKGSSMRDVMPKMMRGGAGGESGMGIMGGMEGMMGQMGKMMDQCITMMDEHQPTKEADKSKG